MEILLAMLISFSIVRDDVHLDLANLSDAEITKLSIEHGLIKE